MAKVRFRVLPGVLLGIVALAVIEAIKAFVESAEFGTGVTVAVSTGCALVSTLITGARDAAKDAKEPEPPPAQPYRQPGPYPPQGRYQPQGSYPPRGSYPPPGQYRPRPKRRGSPAIVAVIVIALLAGAVYGGSTLWRYFAASESGVERMAQPPAKGTAGPLTVTVRGVEVTAHYLKLKLTATNDDPDPIMIPVNSQWCRLVATDGSSLPPYGGITGLTGNIEVPGNGVPVTEVLTFKGQPAGTTFVLSFSTLFGTLNARSLQIRGIELTPA